MKIINFLFFKVYQHSLKSAQAVIINLITPGYVTLLISLNLIEINVTLEILNVAPFIFTNKLISISSFILLFFIIQIYYKKRKAFIENALETNDERKNKQGDVAFYLYLIITITCLYILPFLNKWSKM